MERKLRMSWWNNDGDISEQYPGKYPAGDLSDTVLKNCPDCADREGQLVFKPFDAFGPNLARICRGAYWQDYCAPCRSLRDAKYREKRKKKTVAVPVEVVQETAMMKVGDKILNPVFGAGKVIRVKQPYAEVLFESDNAQREFLTIDLVDWLVIDLWEEVA